MERERGITVKAQTASMIYHVRYSCVLLHRWYRSIAFASIRPFIIYVHIHLFFSPQKTKKHTHTNKTTAQGRGLSGQFGGHPGPRGLLLRGLAVRFSPLCMCCCCCRQIHTHARTPKPTHPHSPNTNHHHSSLSACQGALLLVDATQGIQAQTLSTHARAREHGLTVIPVVTKADLPHAQVDEVTLQMAATLEVGGWILLGGRCGLCVGWGWGGPWYQMQSNTFINSHNHNNNNHLVLPRKNKWQMDLEDVVVTSAKSGLGVQHILPVRAFFIFCRDRERSMVPHLNQILLLVMCVCRYKYMCAYI